MSVIQLGDSMSNGYSPVVGGVPAMPWGGWIAFANGWAYTRYSEAGRTSWEILSELAPRVEGQYSLGCLTVGANDIARRDWDEIRTAAAIRKLWETMAQHTEHVACVRMPDWYFSMIGVPAHVSARTGITNRILEDVSAEFSGSLVTTNDLRGPRYIRPDQVHFTSIGDLAIASRTASMLGDRGVKVIDPASLQLGSPTGPLDLATLLRYGLGASKQAFRQSAKSAIKRW